MPLRKGDDLSLAPVIKAARRKLAALAEADGSLTGMRDAIRTWHAAHPDVPKVQAGERLQSDLLRAGFTPAEVDRLGLRRDMVRQVLTPGR